MKKFTLFEAMLVVMFANSVSSAQFEDITLKGTVNGVIDHVYWGAEDRLGIDIDCHGFGWMVRGGKSIAEVEVTWSHQEGKTVRKTVMDPREMYQLGFEEFAFASDEETVITCIVTVYSRNGEGAPRLLEKRAAHRWRKAGTNDDEPDDDEPDDVPSDEEPPQRSEAIEIGIYRNPTLVCWV